MDSYTLPKTGLEVVLCQTAKFRPSGEPFDGLGVPPDVVMEATPRDRMGKSDSVLYDTIAIQRVHAYIPELIDNARIFYK